MTAKQPRSRNDRKKARELVAKRATAHEEALELSPERARAILDERAHTLARVPRSAPAAGALLEVLTFALGNERYAIETQYLREVLRVKEYIPLPGAPAFLLGITNLRGQFLAIFDPHVFFGLANQPVADLSRIVVLGQQRIEFGILADAVDEVSLLHVDALSESPGTVAGVAREYVRGVTSDSLILLDGAFLLADPRLFIDAGDHGASDPNTE